MPRNKAELALEVARELRIVAAGEALTAEDQADILRRYSSEIQVLEVEGIAFWPDDAVNVQSIPDRVFMPLVEYLAASCAPLFGREYMSKEIKRLALRRVTALPYQGEIVRTSPI